MIRTFPFTLSAAAAVVVLGTGCAAQKAQVKPTVDESTTPVASTAPAAPAPGADDASASRSTAIDLLPVLNFPVVGFEFDSDTVTAEGRAALDEFAAAWRARGATGGLVVSGHCDERGSEEYNLVLGQKRANAVRRYLSALGVPQNAVKTISYGENQPLDRSGTEAAFQRNRRAELSEQL